MAKFYAKKKKFLRYPILIAILLLFILSATHVFSSGKLDVLIKFNEDEWDLNESFSAEWLTNKEQVEFIVDLSRYYDDSLESNDESTEPFSLSANYQNELIEDYLVEEVKSEDDEFNGKYRVVYSLPEEDDNLELELKFDQDNEWEIPTDKNPIEFSIIKDTEAPGIIISGVENEEVFYENLFQKPNYPEGEIKITDPLLGKEDQVEVSLNGVPIRMAWDEEAMLFIGNYQTEEDGVYQLEVNAIDRAGNPSSEHLVFYVNNAGPDFRLYSAGQLIKDLDYVTDHEVKLQIHNNAPIAEVDLIVKKDGEVYNELADIVIDNTSAGLIHNFEEEGTYQIFGTVKDVGENDVSHEIEIHFTVDVSKPKISLFDSNNQSLKGPYQEPLKEVTLTIVDKNLDFDSIDLSILREDLTGEEVVEYSEKEKGKLDIINFDMDKEGIYHIEADATDLAGHKQLFNQSIVVDLESPIITIDADQNELKDVYRDPVKLTFTLSDLTLSEENTTFNIQKYNTETNEFDAYLTKENLDTTTFSASLVQHNFDEGRYQIDISTTDAIGRKEEVQQSFLVDLHDPEIKFESPIESGQHINGGSIEEYEELFSLMIEDKFLDEKMISVTRTDVDGKTEISEEDLGVWQQDSEQPGQHIFSFKENLWQEEGRYDIEITVIDQAGRGAPKEFTFTRDDTAPEIDVPEVAEYHNHNVDVKVNVTEGNYETNDVTVTIERQNSGGDFEDYDGFSLEWKNEGIISSKTYSFTKDGTYRIEIAAVDKAGNKAESVEQEFTIHRYAPELSISGVEDGQSYNKDLNVDLSITSLFLDTKNSNIIIEKWDEEDEKFKAYSNESEESRIPLIRLRLNQMLTEQGDYQIRLTGQDLAGNISETKEIHFVIDKQKPIVSIEGIEDDAIYGENQTIELAVNEKYYKTNQVILTVIRDGKNITDEVKDLIGNDWARQDVESKATYKTRQEGNYTIRLEATDKAGNQADVVEKSFVIDSTVPTITVKGIKDQVDYAEDRTLAVEIKDRNFKQNSITVLKNGDVYDIGNFEVASKDFQDSIARLNYTFTEEGMYDILIESIDHSNNQTEKNLSFIIDKTVPVIKLAKDIPNFITSAAIEKQGINQLIPIDIFEERVNKKEIKITRTSPSGNKKTFKEVEFGMWEKKSDSHYRFKFNNDFFTVDGDYEINIEASDLAGQSARDSLVFTIDDQKPVINLSHISNYNNAPVTQEIEVIEHNYESNDVTIDVYQENNQGQFVTYDHSKIKNWKNSARTSKLSLDFDQDGKYRVVVNAVDAAGNKSETVSQIFTVDQIEPSLSISGVVDQVHYNQGRQVTVEVKDVNLNPNKTNLMIYKLNERTGKMEQYDSVPKVSFSARRANWSHLFSTNDEGIFQIRLNATDWAGNSSSHETITFTIDKTAPVLQANQIEDGQYYGSNQTVEFIVQERHFTENNVDFTVTRNGQNITSSVEGSIGDAWRKVAFRSRLNYHFNQDGAYSVLMNAEDKAGNIATTVDKQFVIDTVNPVIEIVGIEDDQHYNMDRPVSVTIRDVNLDQQTIRVTRDGANYSVGSFSIANQRYQESIASLSHTFSAEGDYVIYVEATDQAGHSDQLELSFTIDKTAPEITPIMGPNGSIIEDGSFINQIFTPVFTLDKPDEDTIDSVTLNNGPNIAGRIPVVGQEMTYQYTVVASDRAGNTTELNVSFVLDTTMPALSITGIIDGFFNKAITPIIEYADDHLDQERTFITLNGMPFNSGTTIQEERDYILKASIADLANNITEQSIVFTVDKTAPTIHFNEPMSNQYFNNVLIPEFFIEDMTDYEIIAMTLNGEPYELGQQIETEGKHVLYFEVRDRAGNIQQLTVEFIIDMTAPELIVEGVEQNQRYYESVDLSIRLLNQEDVIQTITVNGEDHHGNVLDEDNGQQIHLSFIDSGNYHVKVAAYDLAGNQTHQDIHFEIAEKTILMKWYENRPLFTGSIIGLLAITGTGGTLFYRKKQHNSSAK